LIKTSLKYIKNPKRIIDIGAGKGELTFVLSQFLNIKDKEVILLDFSINMLRNSIVKAERVLASFNYLPFRDKSFDIIISSFALHAADDIERAIKELTRVSNGIISCIAFGKPDDKILWNLGKIYLKYIIPCLARMLKANPENYKYIFYIYKKLYKNSFYKKIFEKYLILKIYKEKALNLIYIFIGYPKN
jgi:demethylmenaquinone methyltransferase/2-methoxy-6-polyprenyl-1,4-benzoquinol methylase